MAASSTPSWLLAASRRRAGYGHLRVSDAERAEVADLLSKHYGDGRLDQPEFEARMDLAMRAKTYADLNGLFDDLPQTESSGPPGGPPGAGGALRHEYARGPLQRQHRHHPLLVAGIVVILALTIGHALTWPFGPWIWFGFGPWLWIALVVALVVYVTRRRRGHP
jgi:hypothetical protein